MPPIKFQEALVRNQYETTEGLYQLKLWLSQIQADQEAAKDTNARVDAGSGVGAPVGAGAVRRRGSERNQRQAGSRKPLAHASGRRRK